MCVGAHYVFLPVATVCGCHHSLICGRHAWCWTHLVWYGTNGIKVKKTTPTYKIYMPQRQLCACTHYVFFLFVQKTLQALQYCYSDDSFDCMAIKNKPFGH